MYVYKIRVLQGGRGLERWGSVGWVRGNGRNLSQMPDQLLDVWLGGSDKFSRQGERHAKEDLGGGDARGLLGGGKEAQEDPRQMFRPARASLPGTQGVLQLAMAPLHHAVGLGVIGGGEAVLDSKQLADVGPNS